MIHVQFKVIARAVDIGHASSNGIDETELAKRERINHDFMSQVKT